MTTKRRDFLKGSVAAAELDANGRRQYLLGKIKQLSGCEIVALTDVYKPRNRQAKARASPAANASHLGNPAYRQGKKLRWMS